MKNRIGQRAKLMGTLRTLPTLLALTSMVGAEFIAVWAAANPSVSQLPDMLQTALIVVHELGDAPRTKCAQPTLSTNHILL